MTLKRQKRSKTKLIIPTLFGFIFMLGVANIFLYNQSVGAREKASVVKETVKELRVANAQLKNELYVTTDSAALVAAADRLGLVKESKPTYLSIKKSEDLGQAKTPSTHVTTLLE